MRKVRVTVAFIAHGAALTIRMAVRPSRTLVSRDPCLNRSRYRNTFHTIL